jgi:S-formylglutathione hydrolase FrmB
MPKKTAPTPTNHPASDENVIQKSGAQRGCAKHGLAFVAPDTSPRGLGVEGEADSWDFGVGAGGVGGVDPGFDLGFDLDFDM